MSDLSVVLEEIRAFRGEVNGAINALHGRISKIERNGCGKAEMHGDQENRLRVLETYRAKQLGAAVAIGTLSGIVSGALVFVGKTIIGLLKV